MRELAARGHDDGRRHPRDGLRPRGRRPAGVHGRRRRRRGRRPARACSPTRSTSARRRSCPRCCSRHGRLGRSTRWSRRWPGLPPLDGDVTADACVVGLGGVRAGRGRAPPSSAGCRWSASTPGGSPPARPGATAGSCSAGRRRSCTTRSRLGRRRAVELYRATLAEIDRLAALLRPGVVRRVGSIRLAGLPGPTATPTRRPTATARLADCAAHAAALRAHGIAVEDYDGPLGRGIFLPDDAAMNPARRAVALASRLAAAARLFEHTPVTRGRRRARCDTSRRRRCRRRRSSWRSTAGCRRCCPRSPGGCARRGCRCWPPRRCPRRRLPCPVYGRWGYDYAQQAPDGRLFVGGGRDRFVERRVDDSTDPTAAACRPHIEQVAARMAGGPVTVTHRWAASVGFTADGRPLCTQVAPGVVAVGGYNGTGNLVGPVAAPGGASRSPSTARRRRRYLALLTRRPRSCRRGVTATRTGGGNPGACVRDNGRGDRARRARRRAAPRRAGRGRRQHPAPGRVLHRRLQLPRRARRSSSSRGTSTRSPPRVAVAREHGVAAHRARRRHLDRRQRGRHRPRARLLPPPEPGARGRPRRPHRASSSPARSSTRSPPRPRRTGCASAPTRRPTPAPPSAARSATTPAARGR